jgi:basic membrane protein A
MGNVKIKLLAIAAAFAAFATACGGNPAGPSGGSGGASDVRVAIALDVGGLGDKSFNDAAKRGLDKAVADGLISVPNTKLLETNQTGSNRDENVTNLADAGYNLVWANGFSFSPGIDKIAPQYEDVDFAVQDGYSKDVSNVLNINFKANEGSFLVGAAAALKSKTGTIGFLGGQAGTGLIENFQAGYEAGAKAVNPDINILVEYIGDSVQAFVDQTKGEALSSKMYDQGADVIFHAAGQSGLGLFKAAVETGDPDKLAIGVDSDQYRSASPAEQSHILTSMLKRVDVAIYNTIKAVVEGNFEHGSQVFGLKDNGVAYATSNPELLGDDIQSQLDEFRTKIVNGEITVPEKPEGA